MWRFLLRQNINRYRNRLDQAEDAQERATLEKLLSDAQAELAELEALSTSAVAKYDAHLQFFAQRALDEAVALHDAQFGHLQIYDPASACLVMLAQKNFRAPFLNHFAKVRLGDGSTPARVLASRARVVIPDVNSDPEYEPHIGIAKATGYRAVQSTPFFHDDGQVLGTFSTFFGLPRDFSQQDLLGLDRHAEYIASHFKNWSIPQQRQFFG